MMLVRKLRCSACVMMASLIYMAIRHAVFLFTSRSRES